MLAGSGREGTIHAGFMVGGRIQLWVRLSNTSTQSPLLQHCQTDLIVKGWGKYRILKLWSALHTQKDDGDWSSQVVDQLDNRHSRPPSSFLSLSSQRGKSWQKDIWAGISFGVDDCLILPSSMRLLQGGPIWDTQFLNLALQTHCIDPESCGNTKMRLMTSN